MKYFSTQVACSALVWVFILFFSNPLSAQEYASYTALTVIAIQLVCVVVASTHFTLAFPLTITIVPLSWLIFNAGVSSILPSGWSKHLQLVLAFLLCPTFLLIIFSESFQLWVISWKLQGTWNLPILYYLSNSLSCGLLRGYRVQS